MRISCNGSFQKAHNLNWKKITFNNRFTPVTEISSFKTDFFTQNFYRNLDTMSFPIGTVGEKLPPQYEVFRKKVFPEHAWYNGKISALEMISDRTVKITVRFLCSESFSECKETLIADNDGEISQQRKELPFRLQVLSTDLKSSHSN